MGNILHGDCVEVMAGMDECSVDAIVADPPYGTTACAWDNPLDWSRLWPQIVRVIRPHRAIVLFASQPFTTALVGSRPDLFRYAWVWHKRFAANFVQAKRMPLKTCEDILVFSVGGKHPRYYPQMERRAHPIWKGGNLNAGGQSIPIAQTEFARSFGKKRYDVKFPTTLLEFNVRDDRGHHPTQKPVALLEYLIRTYTQPGETVLDFCAGSGSTLVACGKSGRNWVGIEQDEHYCEIAEARTKAWEEKYREQAQQLALIV